MTDADVLVVGAGLAGLTAARALREAGREPLVLDKAGRPGGRCATRTLAGATVDAGAQFFTVRSEGFRALVDRWTAEGCPIRHWSDGFARARSASDGPGAAGTGGDGHPRYSVTGGMNLLAAHLAADARVRLGVRVHEVCREGGGWTAAAVDGDGRPAVFRAGAVVLTPPVPQALALLGAGGVALEADIQERLRRLDYEPCLTLLVTLDRDPRLPGPGGVQFAEGPVAWLADNAAKGASSVPSLTVHARGDWSETFFSADPAVVTSLLLDAVEPWLAGARPVATEVFRWRYSKPRVPDERGALVVTADPGPLVLAGDALAGAKIEGAVTSGLGAARLLAGERPVADSAG